MTVIELVNPASVGLSSERLNRITTWLEQQVESERLAGASVLVGRRGELAYFKSVGMADVEAARSFKDDTIVRIYSMTKPITTVAAMMLYERGCFQLDDALSKYIPAFADTEVWTGDGCEPMARSITIKQLLTHTAGLTYGFMQANEIDAMYRQRKIEFPSDAVDLEEWANRLAAVPLICQPGSQWNYSVATDLLGRLIEVWSGLSLAEFLRSEILTPLLMLDTDFHVAEANHERFSALYTPLSGGDMSQVANVSGEGRPQKVGLRLHESSSNSPYLAPGKLHSGGGGLTGPIADYARFCQMLMNGGELDGVRLLSPKTVEYMSRNQLPDNKDMAAMGQPVWSETSYDGIGFGLGFAVVIDPVKASIITSEGEYHWGGAASTFFWLDPEEDLFCIFFTQLMPSSTYPIRRELRTRVYQAIVS